MSVAFAPSVATRYKFTDNPDEVEGYVAVLARCKPHVIAIDTETTGLDPIANHLVLVQLFHHDYGAVMFDVRKPQMLEAVRFALEPILCSTRYLKLGHNLEFDYRFIAHNLGLQMVRMYDTMLAERILTAGLNFDCGLGEVARRYLDRHLDKSLQKAWLTLGDASIPGNWLDYGAEDVEVLPPIMNRQLTLLANRGLTHVAQLEMQVLPILANSSVHGVQINRERWERHISSLTQNASERQTALVGDLQAYAEAWRTRAFAVDMAQYTRDLALYTVRTSRREAEAAHVKQLTLDAGGSAKDSQTVGNAWRKLNPPPPSPQKPDFGSGPINLESKQQLSGALTEMGVELPLLNSGLMNTAKETLEEYQDEYPVLKDILEWRGVQKLVSSFGESVLSKMDHAERLHPVYNQIVSTGRMSCRQPNVQQIPSLTELGKEFRRCFIASPGYVLVAADYSQIELRLLAEVSGEESMIQSFRDGLDFHSLTAANMFGLPVKEVKEKYPDKRRAAKAINFGIAYGLTAAGLSKNEHIPYGEAEKYIAQYFRANPRVRAWLDHTAQVGIMQGYTETLMGRPRYIHPLPPRPTGSPFDPIVKLWSKLKARRERQLCNHVIQGSSADITKSAVVRIKRALDQAGHIDAQMVLFVHDEIVVEAPEAKAEEIALIVKAEMLTAAQDFIRGVPVDVEYKIGAEWQH